MGLDIRKATKVVALSPVKVAQGLWDALDEAVNGPPKNKKRV